MQRSSTALNITRVVVLAALSALLFYLFYNEVTGVFVSDIPAHIKVAFSESKSSYSLLFPLLVLSYNVGGPIGVTVLLVAIEIGTIVVCERMIRAFLPEARHEVAFVLALVANFVSAIYLFSIHPHFTSGLSVGNAWHNTTYLAMRFLGLISIWSYLRFVGTLESKNKLLDWAVFTVATMAGVAVKPSFIVAFGPTVVILCIVDLVREGASTLKRSLALAVPFVLVLGVLVYQYTVLFVESSNSEGIAFGIAKVWREKHFFVPLGMLQSYAFPLLVFIFCWKSVKNDRNYLMALILFFISLCIYLFVHELGDRFDHGNFGWSLRFGVFYLFIASFVVYCRNYGFKFPFYLKPDESDGVRAEDAQASPAVRPAFWPELFMLLVLLLHLFSGFGNLIQILSGHGYG